MHITSLTQEALKHHGARALGILGTYWTGLATQGDAPLWSDIDPAHIQDALEYAFMADRVGRTHARLRIAGGTISAELGQDCHGLPLSMLLMPGARHEFGAALATCFDTRTALDLTLSKRRNSTNPPIPARMVLYPLRNDSDAVTRLLGGLAAFGDTGSSPCQFDLTDIRGTPLTRKGHRPTYKDHLRLVVNNT
ncbi:PAS domain-containing protein [Marivita sp.]|uniref:PAS domain-containing protein n=1 Tax=Marivita sp. TaxID=2003365 RepID=UPI003F6BB407